MADARTIALPTPRPCRDLRPACTAAEAVSQRLPAASKARPKPISRRPRCPHEATSAFHGDPMRGVDNPSANGEKSIADRTTAVDVQTVVGPLQRRRAARQRGGPVAVAYGGRRGGIQMAESAGGQASELHLGRVQARPEAARRCPPSHHRAIMCPVATGVCMTALVRLMSEYNRGTGCGKTARPGLWRGLRVTGVPTPEGGLVHNSDQLTSGCIGLSVKHWF